MYIFSFHVESSYLFHLLSFILFDFDDGTYICRCSEYLQRIINNYTSFCKHIIIVITYVPVINEEAFNWHESTN